MLSFLKVGYLFQQKRFFIQYLKKSHRFKIQYRVQRPVIKKLLPPSHKRSKKSLSRDFFNKHNQIVFFALFKVYYWLHHINVANQHL
jgi:hypothetical protein